MYGDGEGFVALSDAVLEGDSEVLRRRGGELHSRACRGGGRRVVG